MQKILLVAAFLLAAVYAADTTISYAGTTTNSSTIAVPTFAGTPVVCTPSATPASYVSFTFNVTVAGMRSVQIMAERDLKNNINVWFYTAFDAANPCTGLVFMRDMGKINSLSGGPPVNDAVYFPVGSYTAVVSSTSGNSGIFAIEIIVPQAHGTIDSSSPTYTATNFPYWSGSACVDYNPGNPVPFNYWTWTATETQLYDVLLAIRNDSLVLNYAYLNIFEGAHNATTLITDVCGSFFAGEYSSGSNGLGVVGLYGVNITAGMTYTFVVSTDQADGYANWGVLMGPTQVRSMKVTPIPGYTQPDRSAPPCAASSNTDASWWAFQFTAVGQVYVIDTSDSPTGSVDTYSFMYYGNNAGSDAVAPLTCPTGDNSLVVYGDTGDVTPVYGFTTPGYNYTVVVSTYGGGNSVGEFILYTFTGTPIGNVPSLTTGTASSGSVTTGAATTGSETGAASTAQVAYVLLLAVLAFLL